MMDGTDLVPAGPATVDPLADPALERYGAPALTAAWLDEARSAHTRRAYLRDLAGFLGWCQADGLDPLAARPADLSRYRAVLAAAAAPSTVQRRLSALSSWYRFLLVNGATATNPLTAVRRPRVDRDASSTVGLTAAEVRALLTAVDGHVAARSTGPAVRYLAALRDRAILRVLAGLGLRVGEVTGLAVTALGHNQGYRTLRYTGKGGRLRERAVPPHVVLAIDEYLAQRATRAGCPVGDLTGPLFATATGAAVAEASVFRLVRRMATAAGLAAAARLSPHSLRHAFATNARELGVALEDVQDAMGHADPRTTRRYDRARHALHREPGLRLGESYTLGDSYP
jgi:integrase/recombinase XerD